MSNAKSVVSLASLAVIVPAALPVLAVVGAVVGIGALLSRKSSDLPDATDASPVTVQPVRRIGLFGIRRRSQEPPVIDQAPKMLPVSQPPALAPTADIVPVVTVPVNQPREERPAARVRRGSVTADDIRAVLAGGPMKRKDAVAALRERTECGQTVAYKAFSAGSNFSDILMEDEYGNILLKTL